MTQTNNPPLNYRDRKKPFVFDYYDSWSLKDEDDTISLWRSEKGGAITISAMRHRDPSHVANAFDHCKRFADQNGIEPISVTGNRQLAEGTFNTPEGSHCHVRTIAEGPRVVIATYNSDVDDSEEEDEAMAILKTVAILKTAGS
jgi:hypothetical protein